MSTAAVILRQAADGGISLTGWGLFWLLFAAMVAGK